MKIAICDDDKFFRNEVKKALDKYSDERKVDVFYTEFSNGHDLIANKNEFDIIFLDYQMESIDGLETAKRLRNNNDKTEIIFLTSYPQIVFDAFQVHTFRFLVKPLDYDKMKAALDDYRNSIDNEEFIILKIDEITKKVSINDIIYAEASDKYCYIRTTKESLLYKKTLSDLESLLPEDYFYRCHRSYIVNFKHIISHTNSDIMFDNNEKALISKVKASGFKKAFLDYVKRNND